MARILTGIQSTGTPHLGNILGAIRPAVQMASDPANESFLFFCFMESRKQKKKGALFGGTNNIVSGKGLGFCVTNDLR